MSSFAASPFGTTLPAYLRYATDKMITRMVLAHGILAFTILVKPPWGVLAAAGCCRNVHIFDILWTLAARRRADCEFCP
jgi:hypothetical protein